jgi:GNAT superfamily N-acetyltransferase
MDIFNDHLALCGKRHISLEKWNDMQYEGTAYCGYFVDDRMVARAAVEKLSRERWEVADVYVTKDHRNLGYGKNVCRFVISYIWDNGKTATIRTEETNEPMKQVIKDLGFVRLEI